MNPKLKKRYRIISCVPVSKETLPRIRVSKLLPEGHGKCVRCGIAATHVIRYTQETENHATVYDNIFAGTIMMTADHILPKALGGRDILTNLQLMCTKCNGKKGCIPTLKEFERIKQNKELYMRMNMSKGQVKTAINYCPYVRCLYEDYFPGGLDSYFDIPSVKKQAKKEGFLRPSGKPVNMKHPHHPLKGWLRIFTKFPELRSHVTFG